MIDCSLQLALFAATTVAAAVPLTTAQIAADRTPQVGAADAHEKRAIPSIDNVDAARVAMTAHLDALREGREAPRFNLTDAVFDALDATGELDAWEREELALRGGRDEADVDDSDEIENWYTAGHDPSWLDAHADDDCEFYLGVPEQSWGWNGLARGVVFVSAVRLARRRAPFPKFHVPLCIDSGGFTQITRHGRYLLSPEEYVALVRRVAASGHVLWAAIQDHMCEDKALHKTGLTVLEHQRRTVESFLRLRELAPEIRWLSVVQGRTVSDYLRHVDMYLAAGVDLTEITRVGVGSICRRSRTAEIDEILDALAARGLRLHMFGGKSHALARNSGRIRSADSMAWAMRGQWETFTTGRRDASGRALQNSQEYAEEWREEMNRHAATRRRRNVGLPHELCKWAIEMAAAEMIAAGHDEDRVARFLAARESDLCALVRRAVKAA